MKRLALLFAGGAVWLLLAAVPVMADGGPHISTVNNGSAGINADSCAGCHRTHTAQGQYLINQPSEEALCLTCHGTANFGSHTDVMTGVQYSVGAAGATRGAQLGALRNGGFDQARMDTGNAARQAYYRNGSPTFDISFRPQVGQVATPVNVTSAHIDLDGAGGVVSNGIAWGNGPNGSGVGPAVPALSCASCHNVHGNGQYRILNAIPNVAPLGGNQVIAVASTTATTTITTAIPHDLNPGDLVTLTNVGGLSGNYAVSTSASAISFTVSAIPFSSTPLTTLTDTTGVGTITATSTPVFDSPLGTRDPVTGEYPTKNYTIVQAKGVQATGAGYLLYASQVSGTEEGDAFHRSVPWSPTVNNAACDPTVFPNAAACASDNDAPNGRPATSTSANSATVPAGQVAFNTQITAWCSACHTRYYATSNPNPVVGGTPALAQAWSLPRPGLTGVGSTDDTYKFQHQTTGNRTCTTCHVAHGSNAQMTGTNSANFPLPNGNQSATVGDSRLLKIDNRGTCNACHDPTGTIPAGNYVGPVPTPAVP